MLEQHAKRVYQAAGMSEEASSGWAEIFQIIKESRARRGAELPLNSPRRQSTPTRRAEKGNVSNLLLFLLLILALLVGAWADTPEPRPEQDSGDYQLEIFR
jgi:ferric-dicitrate binding protein FerR (iron transport regulator)